MWYCQCRYFDCINFFEFQKIGYFDICHLCQERPTLLIVHSRSYLRISKVEGPGVVRRFTKCTMLFCPSVSNTISCNDETIIILCSAEKKQ